MEIKSWQQVKKLFINSFKFWSTYISHEATPVFIIYFYFKVKPKHFWRFTSKQPSFISRITINKILRLPMYMNNMQRKFTYKPWAFYSERIKMSKHSRITTRIVSNQSGHELRSLKQNDNYFISNLLRRYLALSGT